MWSILAARIRIPVDSDVAMVLAAIFGVMVMVALSVPVARLLKRWALPAVAVQVLALLLVATLRGGLGYLFSEFGRGFLLLELLDSVILAWAAIVVWGLRRRVDPLGAIYAALLFAAALGLIGVPLMAATLPGRTDVGGIAGPLMIGRAVYALCLLLMLGLVVPRLKPTWKGVLVGVAAGAFLGSALSGVIQGGRTVAWVANATNALVLAALAAAAIYWLKPEEEVGRVVLDPTVRA